MNIKFSGPVFDYRALRLLVGLIAFALPFVVCFLSSAPLSSISASYYTNARDVFVGMLFVVSAFLWAYNGHTTGESWASKGASLAAILVALCPTACDQCETDIKAVIHYAAAAALFTILAYFCFGPFRKNTRGRGGKKGRRSKIYLACGWIMIGCMLGMGISKLSLPDETINALGTIYWAEAMALIAFGVAWMVAGKYFSPLVDKEEALRLFND
jgi:hypothetical protein